MGGLTYDTGALIAAERNDRRTWRLHDGAISQGLKPTVPAGVLAQAWRGGPQPRLSQFLRGCHIEALDEQLARLVGAKSQAHASPDIVDVSVVVSARPRGDTVVTGDRRHVVPLAGSLGVPVVLV
ncbi:MAG: twitching motility protein PilT [bacterium]|nr:twitching motility protein PilT [bacterium]